MRGGSVTSTHQALARIGESPSWWDDPRKIDLVTRTVAKDANPDELAMFIGICRRTGLDPFSRQIYAIKRWDGAARREVMQTQVSIDGLRLIAQRSREYAGQVGPWWCGPDGAWRDVWLAEEFPAAARVGVMRHGFDEPMFAVAHWREYVQARKDGGVAAMWRRMPALMLAKVAESLALRKAFPQELAGIYSGEEMGVDQPAAPDRYVGTDPLPVEDVAPPPPAPGPPLPFDEATGEVEEPAGITEKQRRRMFAVAREKGVPEEVLRSAIRELRGSIEGDPVESTKGMSVAVYEQVMGRLEDA